MPIAVKPMVVERVDSDLWLLITPTILDDDTRDELLEIGQESGVRLLIHFKNKYANIANELSTSYADSITQQMVDLKSVGLASCRVADFNVFKTRLNNLRKLLPADVPCLDVQFAHKLIIAVRNLGPLVQSELNNAMRLVLHLQPAAQRRIALAAPPV